MDLPIGRLRNGRIEQDSAQLQQQPAQVDCPANRLSVLLIRRFRVRAPDAPPSLTWGYALDQDQILVLLAMKMSAHRITRFRGRRSFRTRQVGTGSADQ
jgi:hypothetical protein